jgi:hypothetical protein
MIFHNFFPPKIGEKLAFLTQNKAKLYKKLIITLVFEKNANFFRRTLAKIAENCDHNIDPGLFSTGTEGCTYLGTKFTLWVCINVHTRE